MGLEVRWGEAIFTETTIHNLSAYLSTRSSSLKYIKNTPKSDSLGHWVDPFLETSLAAL